LDRKEMLDRAATPEDRIIIARLLDKIESVKKEHQAAVTEFYDPYQQNLISPVLSEARGIRFLWAGGYEQAERRRLVLFPDYMDAREINDGLQVLSVRGNFKFKSLSHRDFLGAVMGLGIKRDKVGDIVVTPHGCQVIVDRTVAGYIVRNLTKVHRVSVKVEEMTKEALKLPDDNVKEVFATVPSLRLDAVAASGFGISRSKMADIIKAERVRVNWMVVSDCSYNIREGDKISIRGKGRVEVHKVRGETKKGRLSLVLRRYN